MTNMLLKPTIKASEIRKRLDEWLETQKPKLVEMRVESGVTIRVYEGR